MLIGVLGGRIENTNKKAIKTAEILGEKIALDGHSVICGGETGVMEYVCKGARKKNGTTLGIMKGRSKKKTNKYVKYPILTSMDLARNNIIIWSADGLIALDGGYGTLSEIALTTDVEKPLVVIGDNKYLDWEKFNPDKFLRIPNYGEEAVEKALRALKKLVD